MVFDVEPMQCLFALFALIALHGVFVMAEYSLVRTSAVSRGRPGRRAHYSAKLLLIHDQLEDYLLVCHIGKTMVLLGLGVVLGFLGYRSFGYIEQSSWLIQGQFALWFVSLSVCLLVLGYELPKQVGIRRSDLCAEGLRTHMRICHTLAWPLVLIIRRLSILAGGHRG